MAQIKFTQQRIEWFNDQIQNCLGDAECRKVFEGYVKMLKATPLQLNKVLELYNDMVNASAVFDDDAVFDKIYEINGFNENPLLSLAEQQQKIDYVKAECCRLLSRHDTHKKFIKYLVEHHKQ